MNITYCFPGLPKLKFLPRRFVSPPLEWRHMYGRAMRQTSLENFLVKCNPIVLSKKEKTKVLKQTKISKFFKISKWKENLMFNCDICAMNKSYDIFLFQYFLIRMRPCVLRFWCWEEAFLFFGGTIFHWGKILWSREEKYED
jgi:hypothetical protein